MKTVLKFIGILLLVILLLVAALAACLAKRPSVPTDYTDTVKTGGEIEAACLAMGPHAVSAYEAPAMMSFEKYELFYPQDLSELDGPLPAVVFVNGTGVKASKYPALQEHLASWGFITIATEEEYAWNGFSAEMCVRYLELLNTYEAPAGEQENLFYGKIDLDRVGITGHSQGGIGVINAVTDQKHADIYKAAVILSCGNTPFSAAFQWSFDDTLINTPTMILGSTGTTDAQIASLESLQTLYNNIPRGVTKVLARRNDADHGEMLYYGDGYVTAWFLYYLAGDAAAGDAFFGERAELLTNPLYQDQVVDPGDRAAK